MSHFLGEILIIIFFTAVLWFGIGWWVASIERAKTQRSRESEWNHRLNTLRRDRDAFRDEVEKSHGRIRVLENRRADGNSPPKQQLLSDNERKQYETAIAEHSRNLETATRKLMGYSQQVENLHQQSLERDDILEQLKKKLTDTSRTLHERETRLEQLNQQVTDRAIDSQSQQDQVQDAVLAHEQTITKLRQELAAQQSLHAASPAVENDAGHIQTIEQLRAELQQAQQPDPQINHLQAAVKQLNGELQMARQNLGEQGQAQASHIDHLQESIGKLREELNVARLELAAQSKKSDPQVKQLRQTVEDLTLELRGAQQNLVEQAQTTDPQIASLHTTIEQLRTELNSARQTLVEQANQSDAQVEKLHNMVAHQQDLTARLQAQNETREEAQSDQLSGLRETMAAQEQVVSDLRATLDKAIKASSDAQKDSTRAHHHSVPPQRAFMSPTSGTHNQSGDLFESSYTTGASLLNIDAINKSQSGPSITLHANTPSEVDNLKRVNGIGPAFERVLNSIGIYQYKQLAALTPADVIWVAETMRTFPDRLVKGRWVEQADALAQRGSNQ